MNLGALRPSREMPREVANEPASPELLHPIVACCEFDNGKSTSLVPRQGLDVQQCERAWTQDPLKSWTHIVEACQVYC